MDLCSSYQVYGQILHENWDKTVYKVMVGMALPWFFYLTSTAHIHNKKEGRIKGGNKIFQVFPLNWTITKGWQQQAVVFKSLQLAQNTGNSTICMYFKTI